MGNRISKYRNFDGEKEEGDYEFAGPLRVDNADLEKRCEMLHTLMICWNIKPWDFSTYLQRDIFKGAKKGGQPDEETYDDAIGKLKRLRQENSENDKLSRVEEETKEPTASDNLQNNFGGIAPGGIALFEEDYIPSTGGTDSVEEFNFTMCSTKVGLWTLEGRDCHLIGFRSPFGRADYCEYLDGLGESVVALIRERMEHYSMPEDADSLLFGVNNTIRVLRAHMDNPSNLLYYIVFPDGDYEMTSDLNKTFRSDKLQERIEKYMGKKIYVWLKTKFAQFTK